MTARWAPTWRSIRPSWRPTRSAACQGPANVLVMPARHSAAISTNMLQELGGSTVLGPLLVGFDRPVQILPISARDSDIVNMAALAAYNISG